MKCLILGDGKLATELHRQTGWDYVSRKKDGIDFNDIHSYIDFLEDCDTIINCIANTNTKDNTKEAHWDVNYKSVINLTNFCNTYNKKLVHISTDYLYSGTKSNATEEDVPIHVNNWYCYTKLLADGYVQAMSENYLLIRTSFKSRPYPWDKAWIDMPTNADYVDVISKLIVVYNVGTELKTFYELAKQTKENIQPIMDDYIYNRPHDVSMDLTKLKNTLNI
jgi:dTDP-4-dehydrorhamnose reductase